MAGSLISHLSTCTCILLNDLQVHCTCMRNGKLQVLRDALQFIIISIPRLFSGTLVNCSESKDYNALYFNHIKFWTSKQRTPEYFLACSVYIVYTVSILKWYTVQSNLPMRSPVLKGHLFLVLSQKISYELNFLKEHLLWPLNAGLFILQCSTCIL
jgi:hypothetical protein